MYKSKGPTNGVIHLTSLSIPVQVSLPLLQLTVETRNILVPADGAQVPLVLVVEVDCAECAPRGALADDATVDEPGVAFKVLAVDGEGVCVLVEGLLELLTLIEGVDLVFACACCVDAGAEEDLKLRRLLSVVRYAKKTRGGEEEGNVHRQLGASQWEMQRRRRPRREQRLSRASSCLRKYMGLLMRRAVGWKDVKMVDGRWREVDGGR